MKIVEVKLRRKHICGILFDCEIDPKEFGADSDAVGWLALDSELCEIKHLKPNMDISDSELSELVKESHIKRAKSRALWYLSRGDCARHTLVEKLKRSFPDCAAQAAADRMEELGFINDEAYAKRRLQRIIDEKKVSVRLAKQLLSAEGIDRELVDLAAEDVEYNATDTLVSLIERKYKTRLSEKADIQRTVAALMRKGYSYGEVREALKAFGSESDLYEDC